MNFSAYKIQLVEDFINTFDLFLDEPEHLLTPADLQRFLQTRGVEVSTPVTPTELEDARELREIVRGVWESESAEAMAQRLNALLDQSPVSLHIVAEDGGVAVQYNAPPEMPLIDRLQLDCAIGLMLTVQAHGLDRMRSCAAEPCRDVFVDTSRNKSRRFCSDRCANRYNVAAYRDRQKNED